MLYNFYFLKNPFKNLTNYIKMLKYYHEKNFKKYGTF